MRITTYFVAHEEANGLGGLHPDASVAFSVERQAVALVVNDLEQQACESHPAGPPQHACPTHTVPDYLCDTGENKWGEEPCWEIDYSCQKSLKSGSGETQVMGLLVSWTCRRGKRVFKLENTDQGKLEAPADGESCQGSLQVLWSHLLCMRLPAARLSSIHAQDTAVLN